MSERPLILVIDDETGSRESMALAIEKAGLGVRTFDDARNALGYLQEHPEVRLAVCDLRMPDLDGVGFLEQVRGQEMDLAVIWSPATDRDVRRIEAEGGNLRKYNQALREMLTYMRAEKLIPVRQQR